LKERRILSKAQWLEKKMDIPSAKPFFPREDIDEIKRHLETILESGMLTLGEYTRKFEEAFSDVRKVKHAVAVSSGTSALEIALRIIGLEKNSEVLVPVNTFTPL